MLDSKQRQITDAEKLPIPTVQAIIDGKLTGALSTARRLPPYRIARRPTSTTLSPARGAPSKRAAGRA